MRRFADLRYRFGTLGPTILLFVLLVALVGPLVAPHEPTQTIGVPGTRPGGGAWLGTDGLGRDIFSRVLYGGRTTLGLGALATLLGYLMAIAIGLTAGYLRGWVDGLLMRAVDVLVVFPPLIIVLVLVTGGNKITVLVAAVSIVQIPGMSRVVRTVTMEVGTASYVEAAVARGERAFAVVTREIMPNIIGAVLAPMGLRFAYAIILIASVNFLGLGLQPPTADWGLMVSENRQILALNPYSVLAPAVMIGLLTIGVTMVGDAYAGSLGRRRMGVRV